MFKIDYKYFYLFNKTLNLNKIVTFKYQQILKL